MYLAGLACLGGLATFALGDRRPAARGNIHARQDDGYYGNGGKNVFTYLTPSAPLTSTAGSTTISPSAISTGLVTGTDPGTTSQSVTTSAPYGNFSLSQSVISTGVGSGTAPGTISPTSDPGSTGTAYVYPTLSFPSTGGFFPTRGPYPFPSGSRYQSASSMVGTSPANPSTGGVYPTHGPYSFSKYPFSTGSGFQSASSSVGTIGTAPADPSTGGVHPTHGPYSFSKHPYPSGSGFQPASSSAGPTDPGISESATIGTAISTIGTAIYQSATSIPSPSGSPTWSTNSTITSATSTFDPSASDTIVLSTTGGTGTGIVTGYPSLLTGVPSTFGTSTKFKYTPTTKILPSEYYYHHRKPHHYHQEEERGYGSFDAY